MTKANQKKLDLGDHQIFYFVDPNYNLWKKSSADSTPKVHQIFDKFSTKCEKLAKIGVENVF